MKKPRASALFVIALVLFLHLDSHSSPLLCLPNGLTFPPQGTNSYTCNLFDDGSNPPIVWFPTDWTNHIGDTNWMDGSSNLCCNYYRYVVTGFALPDSELMILSSTNIRDERSNYCTVEFFTNHCWTYTETDETGYPSGQEKVYACKTLDSHGAPLRTNWGWCEFNEQGAFSPPMVIDTNFWFPAISIAMDMRGPPRWFVLRQHFFGQSESQQSLGTGETLGSPGSPDKFIYSPYCMGLGPALAVVLLIMICGGIIVYTIYLIIRWANEIVKQKHSQMENACPDGPPDPCTNSVPSRPS